MASHSDDEFVKKISHCVRNDRYLNTITGEARTDTENEILNTLYLRAKLSGQEFNANYISVVAKHQRFPKPSSDPYVRKARRRAEERRQWGLRADEASLSMTRRSSASEPINELLEREEVETRTRQFRQIEVELERLSPREQEVMAKRLRGEPLRQDERCLHYRSLKKLRVRLT